MGLGIYFHTRYVAKKFGISGKFGNVGDWEFLGFLTSSLWESKAKGVGDPGAALDRLGDTSFQS